MSRRQWGHGYAAGLIDGRRQKPLQEKIFWCLSNNRHLDGTKFDIDCGILDNKAWYMPCPLHYRLSSMSGLVYQYQSEQCVCYVDVSYHGLGFNFPFRTDCKWHGNIIMLYRLLLNVEAYQREAAKREVLPRILDKEAAESFYPDPWFIPLQLPQPEEGQMRGWAPPYAWFAMGDNEERQKQLVANATPVYKAGMPI